MFDSGVGGLTVLSEVARQIPAEDVLYLGDTKRVPYGGRPADEIIQINTEILNYFTELGVKLVIMACGTSSSIAYPVLKDKYKFPIISLVEPGARAALAATKNNRIGLLATVGTVESGSYQKTIKSMKKEAEVIAEGCPLFVPLIEGGFIDTEETRKVARDYLKPLQKENVDTIILGCTHYPHLLGALKELTEGNIVFINPAEEAVKDAKKLLPQRAGHGQYQFVVTGSVLHFEELGSKLYGRPIIAKPVKLGG
ncbi:MAG: glutamate racemase [Candidatus Margulisiibacteriota bacterium]